jgi:hypothetical protein
MRVGSKAVNGGALFLFLVFLLLLFRLIFLLD